MAAMAASRYDASITVQLPLNSILNLNTFGNLEVEKKQKDATIKTITLYTSYKTPGCATVRVHAIDGKNCTFTKNYEMTYTIQILDEREGIIYAQMNFKKNKEVKTQSWYNLDENLVRYIMRSPKDRATAVASLPT